MAGSFQLFTAIVSIVAILFVGIETMMSSQPSPSISKIEFEVQKANYERAMDKLKAEIKLQKEESRLLKSNYEDDKEKLKTENRILKDELRLLKENTAEKARSTDQKATTTTTTTSVQNSNGEDKKYEETFVVDRIQNSNKSPMCSLLPDPIPSTLYTWNSLTKRIIGASRHENDRRWSLEDFTAELLQLVSPDRMDRSINGLPHDWEPVKRVMELLYDRYKNPEKARKVKVLVMGGSLIVGVNCRKIVADNDLHMLMPNRLCTWSHRLETFLNRMMGGDYFEVHKIALGGTNTATGFVMWDSDFIPDEAKHPDILINAYSTNDMHILTVLEAKEGNQTLRDKVMEMTQDFVRSVLKDGPCGPLLLHMDDYLGNEQREILVTNELSQAVTTLASYYGFASMSYANVVKDIVYADTAEEWISPAGWYENGEMVREIHPGMGMHIIATWVTAYNILNLGLTYCTIEGFWNEQKVVDENTVRPYHAIYGFPPLRGKPSIPGKPHGQPKGLAPPLNKQLSLENITAFWKSASPIGEACSSMSRDEHKCPLSWISGISKQGLNASYAETLFTTGYVRQNTGWIVNLDGKKMGISPQNGKLLQMEFTDISVVTMFYMKSYGEKWENSKINMTVRQNDIVLSSAELVGNHAKNTSETYTHKLDFKGDKTKPFELWIELIGGTTFKIMGLAVCK